MPVTTMMNAAKIATAVYTIVAATAMVYFVVQSIQDDRNARARLPDFS